MKILFVCNFGEHRSPTAAKMFKEEHETKSAGIFKNTVTEEQIEWADLVVVMEDEQKLEILKRFPGTKKRTVSLGITDVYGFDDPKLKKIIAEKMKAILQESVS